MTPVSGPKETRADEDHREIVSRELLLLDPAVRSNSDRLRELLHPDFLEFGASGRSWDIDSTVELLGADPSLPSLAATNFKPVTLGTDVVLLTYRLEGARSSLRSSVWVRDTGPWRLRFHQGTLTPSKA